MARPLTAAPVIALAALAVLGTPAARSAPTAAPTVLLRSAKLDVKAGTITLPVSEGKTATGGSVWYVVTESSNRADARRRGVNWSPRLANALGTRAVQRATVAGQELVFRGTVDFRPRSKVVPGDEGFPPAKVRPGSLGDARYSPLVTTDNRIVLNATHVANATGRGDNVVKLDRAAGRVTLKVLTGFTAGRPVHYLRTDASVDVVAALEGSNLAKNLDAAPGLGSNARSSARSAIIPIVNGERGKRNPERQGLQSAVLGEGSPLNIQQSLPGGTDYSPIWDVHPAVWSQKAIDAGQRRRLTSNAEIRAAIKEGRLTSGGTGPANASLGGLKAAGFISNCPTVAVG
jgi:hypothetical protein